MTFMGGKIPHNLIVLETTKKWDTQAFWLDDIDLDNPEIKRQMDAGSYGKYYNMNKDSYRDPYSTTYLFRDPSFKFKADKIERLMLREKALKQPVKKVKIFGPHYSTAANYRQIKKGFFMTMSEPVFSSGKKYAFINFYIYLKEEKKETMNEYYFGDVTIVYERQFNTWKKILCKPNKIL